MDALISFPKAGRTWLRVMLDDLGIEVAYSHAGSQHASGRPLEKLTTAEARQYDRIVFLHRDARDTAVSGFYQKTLRRDGYDGTLSDFIRDPRHGLEKILHFNALWLKLAETRGGMMVSSYEALQADTEAELARIAAFLGAEVTAEQIAAVVAASRFEKMQARERAGAYAERYGKALTPADPSRPESFKVRRGKVGGYRDELSAEDIAWCDARVAAFRLPA